MVRLLDKQREAHLLSDLFDLMQRNMSDVAPTSWQKAKWLAEVGSALKKVPRQIVLMYCEGEFAGFCMYYVNRDVFMVEELQILPEYRSSGVIVSLWKFFLRTVPEETRYMEAWADKENAYSRKLIAFQTVLIVFLMPFQALVKMELIVFRMPVIVVTMPFHRFTKKFLM